MPLTLQGRSLNRLALYGAETAQIRISRGEEKAQRGSTRLFVVLAQEGGQPEALRVVREQDARSLSHGRRPVVWRSRRCGLRRRRAGKMGMREGAICTARFSMRAGSRCLTVEADQAPPRRLKVPALGRTHVGDEHFREMGRIGRQCSPAVSGKQNTSSGPMPPSPIQLPSPGARVLPSSHRGIPRTAPSTSPWPAQQPSAQPAPSAISGSGNGLHGLLRCGRSRMLRERLYARIVVHGTMDRCDPGGTSGSRICRAREYMYPLFSLSGAYQRVERGADPVHRPVCR